MNKSARLYKAKPFNASEGPVCPYCEQPSVLRRASEIYHGEQAHGSLWVCRQYPTCNAYVGTHQRPPLKDYPLGTLANEQLRTARKAVHKVFDLIFQSGLMTRRETYEWLQRELNIKEEDAHIGEMDLLQCNLVYTLVMKFFSGQYAKIKSSQKPFSWAR